MKRSEDFNQLVALAGACTFGVLGAWSAYVMPNNGAFTLGNGSLVVGSIFLVLTVAWSVAFLRYRRAANKGKDKAKDRNWLA